MIVDRDQYDNCIIQVKQKNLFCDLLLCGKKYINSEEKCLSSSRKTSSIAKILGGGLGNRVTHCCPPPWVGKYVNTPPLQRFRKSL